MPKLLALALAAVPLVVPGAAHATAPPGQGQMCGFTSLTNPFDPSGNRQTGYVDGGPVVIADGTDPRAGRITCSLRKGWRHVDPVLASASSVTTPGIVALPATPIEYVIEPAEFFVLCTQVEIVGGGTFYYDADADAWSTDPLVGCVFPGTPDPPPGEPFPDVVELANELVFIPIVDPVLCPVFQSLAPGVDPVTINEQGDVFVAGEWYWDCPPYDLSS